MIKMWREVWEVAVASILPWIVLPLGVAAMIVFAATAPADPERVRQRAAERHDSWVAECAYRRPLAKCIADAERLDFGDWPPSVKP